MLRTAPQGDHRRCWRTQPQPTTGGRADAQGHACRKAQQTLLKIQSLMPRFQNAVDALAHERQALQACMKWSGQLHAGTVDVEPVMDRLSS
jgi:hypothetical protein